MTIDAKRAPGDTALNDATAKESTEVLNVQAQDYSGAIQQEQQRSAVVSEVFVPLIDMEEKGIEVNEAEKQAQWAIDFNKDKLTDQEYEDAYTTLTKSNIVNSLYDTNLRMLDQWATKKQFALEQGINEVDALEELAQEYTPEKLFPNSQMAREMWDQNMYKPFYAQTRAESIQNDLKTAQTKTLNALSNSVNMAVSDIYNGKSSNEAFSNWMRQTALQRSTLSVNDNNRAITETYSNLKYAEAKMLYNTANPGNYSKIKNVLKGMLKENGKKQFQALDENGKPLKDTSTGKDVMLDLSMAAQHIEGISSMIGSLDDKARAEAKRASSGGSSGGVVKDYFDSVYHLDKIQKGEMVPELGGISPADFDKNMGKLRTIINNDPNMSDKQKERELAVLDTHGFTIRNYLANSYELGEASNLKELDERLKSGSEWFQKQIQENKKALQADPSRAWVLNTSNNIAGKGVQALNSARNILRVFDNMRNKSMIDKAFTCNPNVRTAHNDLKNAIKVGNYSDDLLQKAIKVTKRYVGNDSNASGSALPTATWLELYNSMDSLDAKTKNEAIDKLADLFYRNGVHIDISDRSFMESREAKQIRELKTEIMASQSRKFSSSEHKLNYYEKSKTQSKYDVAQDAETFKDNIKGGPIKSVQQAQVYMLREAKKRGFSEDYNELFKIIAEEHYNYEVVRTSGDTGKLQDMLNTQLDNMVYLKNDNLTSNITVFSPYAKIYGDSEDGKNKLNEMINLYAESAQEASDNFSLGFLGKWLGKTGKMTLKVTDYGTLELYRDGSPVVYKDPMNNFQDKTLEIRDFSLIGEALGLTTEQTNQYTADYIKTLLHAHLQNTNKNITRNYVDDYSIEGDKYYGKDYNNKENLSRNLEKADTDSARIFYTLLDSDFTIKYMALMSTEEGRRDIASRTNGVNPFGITGGEYNSVAAAAYIMSSFDGKIDLRRNKQLSDNYALANYTGKDLVTIFSERGLKVSNSRKGFIRPINSFSMEINGQNRFGTGTPDYKKISNIIMTNSDKIDKIICDKAEDYKKLKHLNDKLGRKVVYRSGVLDPHGMMPQVLEKGTIKIESKIPVRNIDNSSSLYIDISNDTHSTQSKALPVFSKDFCIAYAYANQLFPARNRESTYEGYLQSKKEYKAYEIEDQELQNPVYLNRADHQYLQKAYQKLGNEELVAWGACGGRYTVYRNLQRGGVFLGDAAGLNNNMERKEVTFKELLTMDLSGYYVEPAYTNNNDIKNKYNKFITMYRKK